MSKTLLFQIQFIQTVLIQTIQFSISIDFVYTQLNVKTVPFQIIKFSISTQSSSIEPIDRALLGATTPGLSGTGSDSNEGVLCIPQSSSTIGTTPSDCLVSYSGHSPVGMGYYLFAEMQSVYSTAPANWAMERRKMLINFYYYVVALHGVRVNEIS